jgi:hypothetical protein
MWPRVLVGVSIITGQALISQSEWQLALAVGWPAWLAWCAPISLGGYVLAAMLAERGLRGAVATSAVSVVLSHGVYAADLMWSSGVAGRGSLLWPLAAGCSVVPLLVLYRVHGLIERVKRHAPPRASVHRAPSVSGGPVTRPPSVAPVTRGPVSVGGTRQSIAAALADGPVTVPELVAVTGRSRRTVIGHLQGIDGVVKGPDRQYRLNGAAAGVTR